MITLYIVRHGESTDNLRTVWAGWADAPLSNHGMNQAKALAASFAKTPLDAVYASTLKRALWTGQQLQEANENHPTITVSPLLREQGFGDAEGHTFAGDQVEFARKPGRTFKFPNGEALQDVRVRANTAIAEFIEPALRKSYGQSPDRENIAIVAHGIFNYELLGALLSRRPEGIDAFWAYKGMTNTGWTKLIIGYEGEVVGEPMSVDLDSLPGLPPLSVEIVCSDVTTHLEGLQRQKGGIGSAGFDENQKDLRSFFGGAQS